MIELSGITKSFGTLQVLKGIDLLIGKGEIVSIVGPSGAGKTTLINLLMRFYDIDSGTIMISNQNLGEIARGTLRKNVVIVLQDTVLF